MFSNRRLAKRSIVGTKISALRQDGRYYPGIIQSQYAEEGPFLDAVYVVKFEDGFERNIGSKEIIGQGFQPIVASKLRPEQTVFITLNGREVCGTVGQHLPTNDEIVIKIEVNPGENMEVTKRLDEIRLLPSRKSARLIDQDTDYSKLADLQLNEAKKRSVSQGIDMPNKAIRHWQPNDMSENEDQENSCHGNEDVEMMDENIAALVLTSLSCSPVSPKFPGLKDLTNTNSAHYEHQLSTSESSSGFYSGSSERSDPSPPSTSHLSESAPASTGMMFGPFSNDEGLDLDDINENAESSSADQSPKHGLKKTMFQCTWPKCHKIHSTCPGIEKHVRKMHLGRLREGNDTDSEHEEEFYYTEIEVDVDSVTQGFSENLWTSSPSQPVFCEQSHPITDHDYQKKDNQRITSKMLASSVPSSSSFFHHGETTPIPINIPQMKRSLSWQSNTLSSSPSPPIRPAPKMSSQERLLQHQAQSPKSHMLSSPPKSLGLHKKPGVMSGNAERFMGWKTGTCGVRSANGRKHAHDFWIKIEICARVFEKS